MSRPRPRYLTKSRFKIANECPTKLYYTAKKEVYADNSLEDEFLAALAEGGFQVGELAKAMFPGGHDIEEIDYEQSLARTAELLEQEDVVIFEPAFLWKGLFIRVDVLVKRGNAVELIEVKAKSCSGAGEAQFYGAKTKLRSKWRPYLEDAVFQHHVVTQAHPEWQVTPSLMLVNKRAVCPSDGLHQKFLLVQEPGGRSGCKQMSPLTEEELASDLLVQIPLRDSLEEVRDTPSYGPSGEWLLADWIEHLQKKYEADERIWTPPSSACGGCAFHASGEDIASGKRSGFQECWKYAFDFTAEDFARPTVLEVWNSKAKRKWMEEGRCRIDDLTEEDFDFADTTPGAMQTKERQWLQVQKAQRGDTTPEIRADLADEMASWTFPLHFIDFETMSPAIPMHAGCRPYEVLAFQYSHHIVHEDGRVEHAGEYIEKSTGAFPHFDFVRALRKELSGDNGTIFRFAPHENTVLCGIRAQILRQSDPLPDQAELVAFIESITKPRGGDGDAWRAGPRNMVDLCEMVKRYYYDPRMGGSNSIKQVLPAVLNSSDYLREKYAAPIYGTATGMPSLNFTDKVWVEDKAGVITDPYKLLPTMFADFSERDRAELLSRDGSIDNGGAAMTAFARMQYSEMTDLERDHLRGLLLQYCEVDTLAMVMIYEAWREWLIGGASSDFFTKRAEA